MIPVQCPEMTKGAGRFTLSYLNQGEYFILNDRRWVVFRWDDFNKHAVDKVPAGDQSVKTMAAVLHTRLQDLQDAENALILERNGVVFNFNGQGHPSKWMWIKGGPRPWD